DMNARLCKWCAIALALLMPGSFVVLPLLWLCRRYGLLGFAESIRRKALVLITLGSALLAGCAMPLKSDDRRELCAATVREHLAQPDFTPNPLTGPGGPAVGAVSGLGVLALG